MGFLNNHLYTIMKKFPEQSERIEELYFINEDFRSLCSDYLLCIKQLHKFNEEAGEKKLAIEEYMNVRVVVEDELFHFIFHA